MKYDLGARDCPQPKPLNATFRKLLFARLKDGSLVIQLNPFGVPELRIGPQIQYMGSPHAWHRLLP